MLAADNMNTVTENENSGPMKYLLCTSVAAVVAVASLLLSAPPAAAADLVPLQLTLPAPAFKGTPKDLPVGTTVEPLSNTPRPPLMVPSGLSNVAAGKKVTCSVPSSAGSALAKIVDGDKEAYDSSIVMLKKGTQWVQMDLGAKHEIFAIVIWHAHDAPKIFRDVVVQVADDPDFLENVNALFNNDQDNSSGLGVGTHREYFETAEGKLLDTKGVKARYLRFYTKGSTDSPLNEYTEIEVYGRPAQ
jgi:hypothetical protein